MKDKDDEVRWAAASALEYIAVEAKVEEVPALIDALKDNNVIVRAHSAWALGHLGEKGKEALPALVAALKDDHVYVKARAALALGAIGGKAQPVVSALADAMKSENDEVRYAAAKALERIDPKTAKKAGGP